MGSLAKVQTDYKPLPLSPGATMKSKKDQGHHDLNSGKENPSGFMIPLNKEKGLKLMIEADKVSGTTPCFGG